MSNHPLELTFVKSSPRVDDLPPATREIAIVGRSNVGKSSLINALSNRIRLAHTSKTPGRTQLLNLFSLPGGATVMDLPGYGYAKAPGRVRGTWQAMIEGYLLEREGLRMILVLVDGEIGPTPLDVQMLDWLRSCDLPHTIVATKTDKVKSSRRQHRKKELAEACMLEPGDIVWVSASKGVNIDTLRGLIYAWLS